MSSLNDAEARYWWDHAESSLEAVYDRIDDSKTLTEEEKTDIKDTLADIDCALSELKLYIGGELNGNTEKVNETRETD